MVYTSTTRALACLETVVHLSKGKPLPLNRYLVDIEIPAAAWKARTKFDAKRFVGWDAEPPGRTTLAWGKNWLQSGIGLVALVPSVIVPEEMNVLLNPAHADIALVSARIIRKWNYDPRIGANAPSK